MNIRTKLLVAFIVLGLVSTGTAGWQSFVAARAALEATTLDRLVAVRETRRAQVEQWFAQRRALVLDAAENAELMAGVERARIDGGPDSHLASACTRILVRHDVPAMLVLDVVSGRVLCSAVHPATVGQTPGAEDASRIFPMLQRARAGQPRAQHRLDVQSETGVTTDTASVLLDAVEAGVSDTSPAVFCAAPMRRAGTTIAFLLITIPIDQLNTMLTAGSNWLQTGLGRSGETYVVGHDHLMRSDSRFRVEEPDRFYRHLRAQGVDSAIRAGIRRARSTVMRVRVQTPAVDAALRGEVGSRVLHDYRGVQVISSYTPLRIAGLQWVLLAEIDAQEAFSAVVALRERLLLSGLIVLIVGLVVAVVVARSITRPVLTLARSAEDFGAGRTALRAPVTTRDEIGALAATFNAMAEGIANKTMALEREIIERRNAERQLTASRESLRNLSAHLQSVRENERKGVAREIHDELGQALTTLKLELRLLENELEQHASDRTVLQTRLSGMEGIIDTTIRTVKRLISDLRPRLLDDLGLTAAIEWQADEFARRTGIAARVRIHPPDFRLDAERSVAIFRILQEALTNVARHAAATSVTVLLERDEHDVVLEVGDNGRGISGDHTVQPPTTFGLLGITERASGWGGRVDIDGAPGRGTRLRITIPISSNTHDPHSPG